MPTLKFSQMTPDPAPSSDDLVPIVDTTSGSSKVTTVGALLDAVPPKVEFIRTGETLSAQTVFDYDPPGWAGGTSTGSVLVLNAVLHDGASSPMLWQPEQRFLCTPAFSDLITVGGDCWMPRPVSGVTGSSVPQWQTSFAIENNLYTREDGVLWRYEGGEFFLWTPNRNPLYWTFADGSLWAVKSGTGNTGAVEPDWSTAPNPGDTIVDNNLTWLRYPGGTWQADTRMSSAIHETYVLNPHVAVLAADLPGPVNPGTDGWAYRAELTARYRTTSAVEPTWVPGVPVVDGDVVWVTTAWDSYRFPTLVSLAGTQNLEDGHLLTIHNTGSPVNMGGLPTALRVGLPSDPTTTTLMNMYGSFGSFRNPMPGSGIFENSLITPGSSATFAWDAESQTWHCLSPLGLMGFFDLGVG